MDDRVEDLLRQLAAESMAHQFLLDWLLSATWIQLSRKQRLQIAQSLLDASEQTDFVSGLAKGDDFRAERLADIIVRVQHSIDQTIGRALQKTAQIEDERLQQLGEQVLNRKDD